jgi:hypothetical protein
VLAAASIPTYLYEFSYALHWLEDDLLHDLGNYHTSELDFVFGNSWPEFLHGKNFTAEDRFISNTFQGYWANFVVSGNPNVGPSSPPISWPPFTAGKGPSGEVNLQMELPLRLVEENYAEPCDSVWDPFADALQHLGLGNGGTRVEHFKQWALTLKQQRAAKHSNRGKV